MSNYKQYAGVRKQVVLLAALALGACRAQPASEVSVESGESDEADEPAVSLESAETAETTAALISDFLREQMSPGDAWPFVPLNSPEFVTAEEATYLNPQELVLGLSINGESKAYPTSMMWFHHVANDTVGGEPVAVTY